MEIADAGLITWDLAYMVRTLDRNIGNCHPHQHTVRNVQQWEGIAIGKCVQQGRLRHCLHRY